MKRVAQLIRLKPEKYEAYKRLHADVWQSVLDMLHQANIRNYSIYHWNSILFAYFEYIGDDFEADMKKIADDPDTREWWKLTDPMQEPVEDNSAGDDNADWWTIIEEVFHID